MQIVVYTCRLLREPLTTADVTTANATTADVLVLGYGLWVRVWVRAWVRIWVSG